MSPSTMVYLHAESGQYSVWSQCPVGSYTSTWGDPWPVGGGLTDDQFRQIILNDLAQFAHRVEEPPSPVFLARGGAGEFGRGRLVVSIKQSPDGYVFTPFFRYSSGATVSEPSLSRSVRSTDPAGTFADALRGCFDSIRYGHQGDED